MSSLCLALRPAAHFGPAIRSAIPGSDTASAEFVVPLATLARCPATICDRAGVF